jgi:hypothetical protein
MPLMSFKATMEKRINTIQKNANGQIGNIVYNADNRLIEVKNTSNNIIAKAKYV